MIIKLVMHEYLKRSWLQCYVWCHCTESQIDFPTIDETFGWSQNVGFIKPLWYSCSQFPTNMTDINEEAGVYGKQLSSKYEKLISNFSFLNLSSSALSKFIY